MGVMRVGFDARAAFLDPHRGFGRVARSLAEALMRLLPGEVVVFVPHGALVPPQWYALAAQVVHLRRPRRVHVSRLGGSGLTPAPAQPNSLLAAESRPRCEVSPHCSVTGVVHLTHIRHAAGGRTCSRKGGFDGPQWN